MNKSYPNVIKIEVDLKDLEALRFLTSGPQGQRSSDSAYVCIGNFYRELVGGIILTCDHMEFEVPYEYAEDVEVLNHEFSECALLWWLFKESLIDPELDLKGKKSHFIDIQEVQHPVAHMMVSMHLISGINDQIMGPLEYIKIVEKGLSK